FIIADGKIHRFSSNGRRSDDAGWYCYHDGEIPTGMFGCWRGDIKERWRADVGRPLTREEERVHEARIKTLNKRIEEENARLQAEARRKADWVWRASRPSPSGHSYLRGKGVAPHGLRYRHGALVVPIRDASGVLHNLQFIAADGTKRFLKGGRVKGCYFMIGKPDGALYIAEGYATA